MLVPIGVLCYNEKGGEFMIKLAKRKSANSGTILFGCGPNCTGGNCNGSSTSVQYTSGGKK